MFEMCDVALLCPDFRRSAGALTPPWEETKNRSHPSSGTRVPPLGPVGWKGERQGEEGGRQFFSSDKGKLFISKGPSACASMGQVVNCWHISLSAEGKVSRSKHLWGKHLNVVWIWIQFQGFFSQFKMSYAEEKQIRVVPQMNLKLNEKKFSFPQVLAQVKTALLIWFEYFTLINWDMC